MKAFLFKVTLVSGIAFSCTGIGYDVDQALMDACDTLAKTKEFPEMDIKDIELSK